MCWKLIQAQTENGLRQAKVIWNVQLDRSSKRCGRIRSTRKINLRGEAAPLDKLVPRIIRRVRGKGFVAVVLDPIYKVITGDENNASDMGAFCNQFDRICKETGCSMIYSHHHSKGAQGQKKAVDRASGSGVFARDPDALLDLIQLELNDEALGLSASDTATAWRLEGTLREFPSFRPVDFWFEYPVHRVDTSGTLAALSADGGGSDNLKKCDKALAAMARKERMDEAYQLSCLNGVVTLKNMAIFMNVSERCLRNWIQETEDYYVDRSIVIRR